MQRPDKRIGPTPAATGARAKLRNNTDDRQNTAGRLGGQSKPRLADEIRRMAETVVGDDLARVPIDDRLNAGLLLERERLGLAIRAGDLARVRLAFERRQRELAARAPDYLDR